MEQTAADRLATARFRVQHDGGEHTEFIDLLFASSGIEPEIVAAADSIEILPCTATPSTALNRSPG